jgi:TetR/AcrR family transcriptional repressor of nem operon
LLLFAARIAHYVCTTREATTPEDADTDRTDLVNEQGRADATRKQILRAAAHQFARTPYSAVSLDDVLADAEVTKGAMYFHFKSKYALALAIIEKQSRLGIAAVDDLLSRKLSALETLVDVSHLIGTQDIGNELTRAGLNLLESTGREEAVRANVLEQWIKALATVVQRAIIEGDALEQCQPTVVGRLLVSLYLGLRQTGNLNNPGEFFTDLERAWAMVLPGFATPDRIGYLTQFIRRRTAIAIDAASGLPPMVPRSH